MKDKEKGNPIRVAKKLRAVAVEALEEAKKVKKYQSDGYHTTPEYDALFDSPERKGKRRDAKKNSSNR